MSAHTSFRKGTPVFVQLKDGNSFKDVFEERKSLWIVLRKHGRVPVASLRAVSIAR